MHHKAMTRLMDLPGEILLEILKRPPVKAVYCIQCVSKTLLELVDSYLFASLHSGSQSITNAVAEEPQLMLRCLRSLDGKTQTSLKSLNYSGCNKGESNVAEIMSIIDKHHYTIPFVFNNLICFKNVCKHESCFLVEPFRRQVLKLPPSKIFHTKYGTDREACHECYSMGFDCITSTFKIIRISELDFYTDDRVAQVLVLGTSSWHEVPLPPFGLSSGSFDNAKSIFVYGDVHWLCKSESNGVTVNHIITFDFRKEEFYSTTQPATKPLQYLKLVTLKGSMAIMDCSSYNRIDIWVMEDYNTKQWTLECSITSYMFASYKPSIFVKLTWGEWENGIYFISNATQSLYFDLRQVPVTCVKRPIGKLEGISEISILKHSFLSLKTFGNLIEKTETGSQSQPDIRWLQPTLKEKQMAASDHRLEEFYS